MSKTHDFYKNHAIEFAHKKGWRKGIFFENKNIIQFKRMEDFIDIWRTKFMVVTLVNHPTRGHSILIREKVSIKELEKILCNPRAHTGKGKYLQGQNSNA